MECKHIVFSGHAIRQMFSRGLTKQDVLAVIQHGQVIMEYPDDKPYPSCLVLGFVRNLPLHVVVAINAEQQAGIVVTAYVPDHKIWSDDFRTRRSEP